MDIEKIKKELDEILELSSRKAGDFAVTDDSGDYESDRTEASMEPSKYNVKDDAIPIDKHLNVNQHDRFIQVLGLIDLALHSNNLLPFEEEFDNARVDQMTSISNSEGLKEIKIVPVLTDQTDLETQVETDDLALDSANDRKTPSPIKDEPQMLIRRMMDTQAAAVINAASPYNQTQNEFDDRATYFRRHSEQCPCKCFVHYKNTEADEYVLEPEYFEGMFQSKDESKKTKEAAQDTKKEVEVVQTEKKGSDEAATSSSVYQTELQDEILKLSTPKAGEFAVTDDFDYSESELKEATTESGFKCDVDDDAIKQDNRLNVDALMTQHDRFIQVLGLNDLPSNKQPPVDEQLSNVRVDEDQTGHQISDSVALMEHEVVSVSTGQAEDSANDRPASIPTKDEPQLVIRRLIDAQATNAINETQIEADDGATPCSCSCHYQHDEIKAEKMFQAKKEAKDVQAETSPSTQAGEFAVTDDFGYYKTEPAEEAVEPSKYDVKDDAIPNDKHFNVTQHDRFIQVLGLIDLALLSDDQEPIEEQLDNVQVDDLMDQTGHQFSTDQINVSTYNRQAPSPIQGKPKMLIKRMMEPEDDDGYFNLPKMSSVELSDVTSSAWIDDNATFKVSKEPSATKVSRAPLGSRGAPRVSITTDEAASISTATLPQKKSGRLCKCKTFLQRVSKVFRKSKE